MFVKKNTIQILNLNNFMSIVNNLSADHSDDNLVLISEIEDTNDEVGNYQDKESVSRGYELASRYISDGVFDTKNHLPLLTTSSVFKNLPLHFQSILSNLSLLHAATRI